MDQFASLGGGQRILLDLVTEFRQRGHVCAVALPGPGEVSETLERMGVPVHFVDVPQLNSGAKSVRDLASFLAGSRRLARQLRTICSAYDAIYVNGPRCVLAAVLSKHRNVLASVHLIHRGAERRLLEWCFRRPQVKMVSFCSKFAMEPFAQLPNGIVVNNWVSGDILEMPTDRQSARRARGLRDRDIAIGVLGRISKEKGQVLLCRALEPLLAKNDKVSLHIAGSTDHDSPGEAEELADVAEWCDRIVYCGKVHDVARFLDAMDILVVPSVWEEPFGLVALEGMARGLPVVATKRGGLTEIVEHGVTGYLAEPRADALLQMVTLLVEDADSRAKMGAAGRERVERDFHPSGRLHKLAKLAALKLSGA